MTRPTRPLYLLYIQGSGLEIGCPNEFSVNNFFRLCLFWMNDLNSVSLRTPDFILLYFTDWG